MVEDARPFTQPAYIPHNIIFDGTFEEDPAALKYDEPSIHAWKLDEEATWSWVRGAISQLSASDAEQITNGAFASDTEWERGGNWTISGGKLNRALPSAATYAFDTTAQGWDSGGFYWTALNGGTLRHDATTASFVATSPAQSLTIGGTYTVAFRAYKIGHLPYYGNLTLVASLGGTNSATYGPLPEDSVSPNYQDISFSIVAGAVDDFLKITFTGLAGTTGFPGALIDNVVITPPAISITSAKQLAADLVSPIVEDVQYCLTYTLSGVTGGNLTPKVGGTSGTVRTEAGTYTEFLTAGAAGELEFEATDGLLVGSIDDVSLIRARLLKQFSTKMLDPKLEAGKSYKLVFTMTRSAGTLRPILAGTAGTERSSSSEFTETIVCGSTTPLALEFSGLGFVGSITNVELWTVYDPDTRWVLSPQFVAPGEVTAESL